MTRLSRVPSIADRFAVRSLADIDESMWGSFRSTPGYPSVKFHGKVDIGFGCKVLKDTSQVKWERIKGRGFKYNKFNFTVAVYDEEGNSNLDRGRFPVCTRPEDMKQLTEQRKAQNGRKPDADRQAKIDFARSVEGSLQDKANAVNEKFGRLSLAKKLCRFFIADLALLYEITMNSDGVRVEKLFLKFSNP